MTYADIIGVLVFIVVSASVRFAWIAAEDLIRIRRKLGDY